MKQCTSFPLDVCTIGKLMFFDSKWLNVYIVSNHVKSLKCGVHELITLFSDNHELNHLIDQKIS